MADGFEAMVDTAVAFFAELETNNSKDWFDPRKAQYTSEIKKPAELFGDLIAEDLSRVMGRSHAPKLFRIYRDIRFSKDKSPLNAHLHLMWSNPNRAELEPVWFFGLSPSYFILGGGVMGLKGPSLARFRAHIDRDGDALRDALSAGAEQGVAISDWGPEPLKRVPKPFAPDHPHAELLKRKALAVNVPIASSWREKGLIRAVNDSILVLRPILNAMSPEP